MCKLFVLDKYTRYEKTHIKQLHEKYKYTMNTIL